MSHWHEPLPDESWGRCVHCGRPTQWRASKHREPTCPDLKCNLAEDRLERERQMTGVELDTYCRTVEAYFSRPDDPKDTYRPMKAPTGLSRISSREISRQEFDRAARENDEKMALIEAQKKVWEVDL